ncbi:Pisatin demethylase [Cytospora mali]|uniref:Cytochrome P450 monooxygenase ABA1 n=1 Tax=Cytospora mali TaxID=578113 RepID=A0A194UNH3_CYTMA|nr:Pisatin demethylase [Valsa mali var. pyri (nom. inval.)]
MIRVWYSGRQSAGYKGLNTKYNSSLVRIGPNDLITDDPNIIKRMSGARSNYGRSSWYTSMKLNPYDDSLFNMLDVKEHDKLKAKLSFGYSARENPGLEQGIDEQIHQLVHLIRRSYISGGGMWRPMDFARVSLLFTLDALTQVAYGKAFGYLTTETDIYGYMEAMEDLGPWLVVSGEVPWIGKITFSKMMLSIIGPKPNDKKGMGKLLHVAEEMVADRLSFSNKKEQNDMLGAFIRHGATPRQCELEIPFQILAGSDTTAATIRGTLLYLTTSRVAYDTLQSEIDEAIASGKISNPIRNDEAKEMKYLQAVIYEGMRMQLPYTGLLMKQAPPEGDTINGMFIPGGTRIAHNTVAMQRSTATFGNDADVFRPERWLEASPERAKEMTMVVEMVFGYGRWMCAGKTVAFIELNKVFVELLRHFDFQLVNPTHPWDELNLNMYWHHNMWMRVSERHRSNEV